MLTTEPTDTTITMITATENTTDMGNIMLTAKTINMMTAIVTTKEHVTNETMVQEEVTMGPTDPTDRLTAVATA